MACESANMDWLNPELGAYDCWERWIRFAVFPMVLQTYVLDTLTANLSGVDDTYFFIEPDPIYVNAGILIFLYEAFTQLIGSSLMCLYCVMQTDYANHPSPMKTQV